MNVAIELQSRPSGGAYHFDTGLEVGPEREPADWKPGRQQWAVILTLAFISLIVALDATILVSVLPVRGPGQDGIS
jgi:hypothetical protein